jgi:3-oxoadipate enol-lactonase
MPILSNGDCRIYWRGDGDTQLPALVLGNSLGTDITLWDPMLEALMRHFYVVRFDTRGHGGSDIPVGPYSIEQLADDAQAVIAAARLSHYSYWGISLGGMVGMELAARKPTGLKKLVLSHTAAEFDAGIWDQRIAALKTGGMPAIIDGVITRFFTPDFVAQNTVNLKRIRNIALSQAPSGYAACCGAIRDMNLYPRLERIQVPTLVVVGELDLSTPEARGQGLIERIKGARMVKVRSAHIAPPEIPNEYLAAVLPFIS